MNWEFDNDRPIYKQLCEQIKLFVLMGVYKEGEKIPSVRDLAFETKVNPNTVQKALAELENEKYLVTDRTNGKYVTDNLKFIEKVKEEMIDLKLNEFLDLMNKFGVTKKEVIKLLKRGE